MSETTTPATPPEVERSAAGSGSREAGGYDVVVVGSGAAGLLAALAAADAGARVLVLEAADRWGGTSGLSAGAVWVPGNAVSDAASGGDGSGGDALAYCLRHAPGRDPALVEAFLRAAPGMARFVAETTELTWAPMGYPDTFAETPGGRESGRHIEAEPVVVGDLGPVGSLVWPMAYPPVLTNEEVFSRGVHGGGDLPYPLLQARTEADQVAMGLALVVGLLRAGRALGVTYEDSSRVVELVREADRVRGVVVSAGGGTRTVTAARGVVLACGGYEWDAGLAGRLLGAPATYPLSPPVNRGDALRLGARAGAELAHLGESWCWPAVRIPEQTWPGTDAPRPHMVVSERTMPHVLWVDATGRRFVNEAAHNCALALADTDPTTHQPLHHPAFAVGDEQFRARYSVVGTAPGRPLPDWVPVADTLAGLAARIGVPADALVASVDRFNVGAREGRDPDFGRGDTVYDRYTGDPTAAHPTLGTVERGPFFALPLDRGTIATKGGIRTDADARALGWDAAPVPGLYAAGTAAAALFGPGAIANGMHLSFSLTWGMLAGRTAAADR